MTTPTFTIRERDILADMADGFTSRESGERLFLSPDTIKGYRKVIIFKLGAKNGTEAVALAIKNRIIY